jgi:hypothetical protein
VRELAALREDVRELVRDESLAERIEERFERARFPFRHDRLVPRITVTGSGGPTSLEPGFRNVRPWAEEAKRELIERGYVLASAAFNVHGIG